MTLFKSFIAILFGCLSVVSAADIKSRIVNYGVYKVSPREVKVASPGTPSGVTRIPEGVAIIGSSTNRIPARLGLRFGLVYELTNISATNRVVVVTKVVSHPAIRKPDGTESTGFTFMEKHEASGGGLVAWTGYGFDHSYELVSGIWKIELRCDGKIVAEQEFEVFKESKAGN